MMLRFLGCSLLVTHICEAAVFRKLRRATSNRTGISKNCHGDDECNAEWISKYGIMTSMDVHPLNTMSPISDTEKLDAALYGRIMASGATSNAPALLGTEAEIANAAAQGISAFNSHGYVQHLRRRGRGATVYVVATALPRFVAEVLPQVEQPFVLITGDAVVEVPSGVFDSEAQATAFLDDPRLLHWFGQNGNSDHAKFSRIPNGLDYHTLYRSQRGDWGPVETPVEQERRLNEAIASAPAFESRSARPLAGPWSGSYQNRDGTRQILSASQAFDARDVHLTREAYWQELGKHQFVVSPRGAGADCHRTWEALVLGAIPLVDATAIDPMWAEHGLPVGVVQDWKALAALSSDGIQETFAAQMVQRKAGVPKALTLKYWVDLINAKAGKADI